MLNTSVRTVELCPVSLLIASFSCLCRSSTEFILSHDRLCHICCLSSMHKSRSVVKYFVMIAEPVQQLSFCVCLHWKGAASSVFICCYVTRCVVLDSLLVLCSSLLVIAPQGALCQEQVRVRARRTVRLDPSVWSAHSEQCEIAWFPHAHSVKSWLDLSEHLTGSKFVFYLAHVSRAKIVSGALCTCWSTSCGKLGSSESFRVL